MRQLNQEHAICCAVRELHHLHHENCNVLLHPEILFLLKYQQHQHIHLPGIPQLLVFHQIVSFADDLNSLQKYVTDEHNHLVGNNLGSVSFDAVLVFPIPGLNPPFDIDLFTFCQVLTANFT